MNVDIYIPIANLEPVQTYEQIFLVSSISYNDRMKTSAGKNFARVSLKDTTGEIEGVIWGYSEDLHEGCYASIKIETKTYKNNIEFQAQGSDVILLDNPPSNVYDYVRGVSESNLVHYAREVEEIVESVSDQTYRDILSHAIHRLDLIQALKESPYGLTGPMAYRGGLLVHTVHTARFAIVAGNQAKEQEILFCPSLVVAGCLLKNIGWHTTTRFQGDYLRPRDAYHMTGIKRASARYIDHLILTCKSDLQVEIPEPKIQALENMCDDSIFTLEGKIVNCADEMANVIDFGSATLQKKQKGNWSDNLFIGHLK